MPCARINRASVTRDSAVWGRLVAGAPL